MAKQQKTGGSLDSKTRQSILSAVAAVTPKKTVSGYNALNAALTPKKPKKR